MQKDLNLREKLVLNIEKLKPVLYIALALRALTFDSVFAQTENPSDHFKIPFGNLVTDNIPENLHYDYWIDSLEKTDSLALFAIEFESVMKNIPAEVRQNAEANYKSLFQEILDEIKSSEVSDRDDKLKIIVEKIKSFKLEDEVNQSSPYSVSVLDFLTEAQNKEIVCTPATILALDYAKNLGINGLKTALTFKHVFLYDEETDRYIDLNDDVIYKAEAEAKIIRGEEIEHDGVYLLSAKNILGMLASNLIYTMKLNDPYFQNKNKMLYDLSYYLDNPGVILDYAEKLSRTGDKETDLLKQNNLYIKALEESEKIDKTPFSFALTKELVLRIRDKLRKRFISSSTN